MKNYTRAFTEIGDVVVVLSKIENCQGLITDEELDSVRTAAPVRIRQFVAGRTISRFALGLIGAQAAAIPASHGRLPIWPTGIVGSISHTDAIVGVALAKQRDYQGLGFDIEVDQVLTPDLRSMILTHFEETELNAELPPEKSISIFSCKESVYKAVYPVVEEYLDFHDVHIELHENSFTATINDANRSSEVIVRGRGYHEKQDGLVRSLFLF